MVMIAKMSNFFETHSLKLLEADVSVTAVLLIFVYFLLGLYFFAFLLRVKKGNCYYNY